MERKITKTHKILNSNKFFLPNIVAILIEYETARLQLTVNHAICITYISDAHETFHAIDNAQFIQTCIK